MYPLDLWSVLRARFPSIRSKLTRRPHCRFEQMPGGKSQLQVTEITAGQSLRAITSCRRNILVIDNNAERVALLTRILAEEGYAIRSIDSAATALAVVNAELPDLILLDISISSPGALEICRQLKSAKPSRHIPIIFLSGAHQMDLTADGLALGAADHITVPCRVEELLGRVRTQLDLRALKTELEQLVGQRTLELTAANERIRLELAERKRADEISRRNHERFRSIADAAPVIIWAAGPKQEPEFLNKQACLLTGRTLEELRRNGWRASIHPADLNWRDATYVRALKYQKPFQMEYRLRGANGTYHPVLSIGVPRILDHSFAGHLGIIIDISDFKKIQEQIFIAQKFECVSSLVAGIAHDFNNLVGAILGEVDLALTEVSDNFPVRENLDRINYVALRASEIVQLLMTYATDDNVGAETVDLRALITEMVLDLKASISKKAVLQTELSPSVPPIQANPVQLRQVIVNLITNASEALEDQPGSIIVSTTCISTDLESNRRDRVSSPTGDYVRLAVTDTGCGIADETLSKVFDPFYTTKFLGRGLGLAVVHGIVRAHGGLINVASRPGEGSTFEILFPCRARQPAGISVSTRSGAVPEPAIEATGEG